MGYPYTHKLVISFRKHILGVLLWPSLTRQRWITQVVMLVERRAKASPPTVMYFKPWTLRPHSQLILVSFMQTKVIPCHLLVSSIVYPLSSWIQIDDLRISPDQLPLHCGRFKHEHHSPSWPSNHNPLLDHQLSARDNSQPGLFGNTQRHVWLSKLWCVQTCYWHLTLVTIL